MHTSVLSQELMNGLAIKEKDVVVDGTLGAAGHSALLARSLGREGVLVGIDLDEDAIARAKVRLADAPCTVHLRVGNFRDLSNILDELGVTRIDKAVFDLGYSSDQLEGSGRGFSFQRDEPLLMTLVKNPRSDAVTAGIVINEWSEETLEQILAGFGEERFAKRIARAIVEARARRPITTSMELARVVAAAVPRRGKMHPATKTFQAVRIAVNDELGALTEGISAAKERLSTGGRLAVISFHSLEDRIVKRLFRTWEKNKKGVVRTKKPIRAGATERKQNPRSRSAKLRIFEGL